jgi:hypothetical protein
MQALFLKLLDVLSALRKIDSTIKKKFMRVYLLITIRNERSLLLMRR